MDFAVGIQENLIAILAYNEDHARQVRNLVPANLYSKFYRELFEATSEYLDKYDQVPGEHFIDLVERICRLKPKDKDIYLDLSGSVNSLADTANVKFVIERASEFAEYQTLKSGVAQSLEALAIGGPLGILETRNAMQKALDASYETFDPGLKLSDKERFLGFLNADKLECFPTGIPELDRLGLGPTRTRLHILGAPYGRGKSWWLTHLAKHAFAARCRVLYVSLEMKEPEMCERISMAFFGYGKIDEEHEFFKINPDEGGRVLDLEAMAQYAPNLERSPDQAALAVKVELFQRREAFIIKHWPSGKMSMRMLEAYLDNLAASEGFVPDIIFVDYLGISEIKEAKNKRVELGQLAIDFRGICQARNCAGVSVAQMNRSSLSTEVTDGEQVAEDFSITQHADFFFTYNQTKAEKRLGAARIWVDKGRPSKAGFTILLTQDYGRGQFAVSSARMADTYWDTVKSLVGGQDGD